MTRVLIVALILVGQFPLRVCSCGAHAHPPEPVSTADAESEPIHHHPDCPAANPRPCLEVAPPAAIQTAPADDASATVFAVPESVAAPVVFAEPPPVRPPVPLFLAFLALRN